MLWIAHALTLVRIPLAIAFYYTFATPHLALAAIGAAALTDTLDGTLARALKRRGAGGPDIGGWLDPAMDKVFVVLVVIALWLRTHDTLLLALVGARELLFLPLAAVYLARHQARGNLHADPLGKAATVAQFAALAVIVGWPEYALPAALATAALGIAAVTSYLVRVLRLPRGSGATASSR